MYGSPSPTYIMKNFTKTQKSEIVTTNPGSDKVKGLHAVKKEKTNFHKSHGLNYKTVIVWDLYYEELHKLAWCIKIVKQRQFHFHSEKEKEKSIIGGGDDLLS